MHKRDNCGVGFYLVTTDHLSDKIWFRDKADFKVGMNAVPIVALATGVKVVAFILMSNHVHFLLFCSYDDARRFIAEYKGFYSRYMRRKYGIREMLRGNKEDVREIEMQKDSVEWVIAYIHMNCVAANICLQPSDYPWGTGRSFFRFESAKGTRLDNLSKRARSKLMHSEKDLPGYLLVGEDGYIIPDSYVDVKFVETLFRTPKRMQFFQVNSSKAKRRLNDVNAELPSFPDQLIAAAVVSLCQTLFQKRSVQELSQAQLTELLRQLRFRFSSHAEQLARVVGLTYGKVVSLLDSPA